MHFYKNQQKELSIAAFTSGSRRCNNKTVRKVLLVSLLLSSCSCLVLHIWWWPPTETGDLWKSTVHVKEEDMNGFELKASAVTNTTSSPAPHILHYLKTAAELEEGLPHFLTRYIQWHRDMRKKFPGKQIIEHPDAPKVVIRYTSGPSNLEGGGGLYDRLAVNFVSDFLWASHNQRVLLYLWHHPRPLTDFLAPNHMDWTVPEGVIGLECAVDTIGQRRFIVTSTMNDTLANIKVLLYRSPRSLIPPVERDKYNNSIPLPIAFNKLWNIAFKPNPYVQVKLNEFWNEHHPGEYSAAHIRLLHPSFYHFGAAGVTSWKEDQNIPWNNETQTITVPPTIHALRCAVQNDTNRPVYLLSDWITVVKHLHSTRCQNHSLAVSNSTLGVWMVEKMKYIPLLYNPIQTAAVHIAAPNETLEAYAATFVDVYIAMGAKCLSYGLGRFGYLASLIGGNLCLNRHQHPSNYNIRRWNMWESSQGAPMCHLVPDYPLSIDPDIVFKDYWNHAGES